MNSSSRRNQWVYISLAIMIFLLVAFSLAPLISSIFLTRQETTTALNSQAQRLENAVLGYQMVIEREPDNQAAWRGLLTTRLQQGKLQEALLPLEKLAQLNPSSSDYQMLLAQTQEQLQDYNGAIASYQTLINRQPDNLRALKGLVDLLVAQKRGPEAIKFVQQMRQKAQTNPQTNIDTVALQLLLGEIYSTQAEYDQAIAIYQQAQQAAPEDFRPFLAQALTLKQQGKTAAALFAKARELAPGQYQEQIQALSLEPPASQ
jgi:tetratricopeptide (TPR) repeat protein